MVKRVVSVPVLDEDAPNNAKATVELLISMTTDTKTHREASLKNR